jgi:hypothetical protein
MASAASLREIELKSADQGNYVDFWEPQDKVVLDGCFTKEQLKTVLKALESKTKSEAEALTWETYNR